jgi:hypothetical protein
VKRLPGSDQHVEGREERYLLSRPSRFAERHSRHRLEIVALEGALARRLAMRRSRPTATLTCRRPPATAEMCRLAWLVAASRNNGLKPGDLEAIYRGNAERPLPRSRSEAHEDICRSSQRHRSTAAAQGGFSPAYRQGTLRRRSRAAANGPCRIRALTPRSCTHSLDGQNGSPVDVERGQHHLGDRIKSNDYSARTDSATSSFPLIGCKAGAVQAALGHPKFGSKFQSTLMRDDFFVRIKSSALVRAIVRSSQR